MMNAASAQCVVYISLLLVFIYPSIGGGHPLWMSAHVGIDDTNLASPANTQWLAGVWELRESVVREIHGGSITYDSAFVRCTHVEAEDACCVEVSVRRTEERLGGYQNSTHGCRVRLSFDASTEEVQQEWQSRRTGAWLKFALPSERSTVKSSDDRVTLRLGQGGERFSIHKLHNEEDTVVLIVDSTELVLKKKNRVEGVKD